MISMVLQIVVLVVAIVCHEVAHGFVAFKLGDPTAKNQGRLTLNPVPHIDKVGSIILPGLLVLMGTPFLFGWAKPVPVNPRYFKKPYLGMCLVALAGPASNIALAIGAVLIMGLFGVSMFLIAWVQINLVLAIFNLMPIPPLDGSRVLMFLLPDNWKSYLHRLEPYGFIGIMIMIYFGWFSYVFQVVFPPLYNGMMRLGGF